MPSPFPGMDPFLEHPHYFPGLHGALQYVICRTLQKELPEPYFAVINERLWVETHDRTIEPDVDVLRGRGPSRPKTSPPNGVGLATRTPPLVIKVPQDERRQTYVEIRTKPTEDEERIVTTIEALSLTNKTPGEKGRDLYLQKQREILEGNIHLVEIDLLRDGEHTTAVPRQKIVREHGPFDYHVCVHPFDHAEDFLVYPFQLEDSLPEIAIPLLPGDGAVPLDLQAVFTQCYEEGPYQRRIRYGLSRIVPPLNPKKKRWSKQVLKEAGMIP